MYLLKVIKNIFYVLDDRSKKQYAILQVFFFVSALFQVIGIASIGPFITILANQEIIHKNIMLSTVYDYFNFSSDYYFIIATAVVSVIMIILSNSVAAITVWLTYKFSVKIGSKLQHSIYKSYLNKSYLYHKSNNYNHPISVVSQQIPRFVYMLLQPFLLLTSQLFLALIVLSGLLILDPMMALSAGGVVGGAYLLTYIYLRRYLSRSGDIVSHRNSKIQSILSESFIGIKDIKINSMESIYTSRFDEVNSKGLGAQAAIILAGDVPRFVIETISLSAILLLAIGLLSSRPDPSSVVPVLSIYALAGYKLLPTMQQVYKSLSTLSGHGSVAFVLREEFNSKVDVDEDKIKDIKPIKLDKVELKGITFHYPKCERPAIDSVSLQLERGFIYSLAGHSGSGKSTLADILLGLIDVDEGEIVVNDKTLNREDIDSFRASISYVGQNIFIVDGSVINNVAFGEGLQDIDLERVKSALKLADAYDFVNKLPKGMYTELGQDGKTLSGGQRQRIGVARALYKKSDLLVLDEPTSALDIESEYKLLEALNSLKRNSIILIISHRPASIKMSDRIVLMSNGMIEGFGTFDELLRNNYSFSRMMEQPVVEETK